jgi:hypothetical protein
MRCRCVRSMGLCIAMMIGASAGSPAVAQGAGAGYYVSQCASQYRATPDIGDSAAGAYIAQNKCQQGDARLQIENAGAAVINQGAQYTMTAPSGTSIIEVHLDANLRRGSGHRAEIAVWNGSSVVPLAVGPDSNPSWQHYDFGGLNDPQLVLRLYCSNGNCPADSQAHLYARDITVLLADNADPGVGDVGGSLLSGGWQRGTQTLTAGATDVGGGVRGVSASVNGQTVGAGGTCDTGGLSFPSTGPIVPCAGSANVNLPLDTTVPPFRNGTNTVEINANDYPGNQAVAVTRSVMVDNQAPSAAFANAQDPADPETIRLALSDAHSGVTSAAIFYRASGDEEWEPLDTTLGDGQATAHVDSLGAPAGEYEFLARVADAAGNVSSTTQRADGEPMRLTFPLRDRVELHAHLNRGGSRAQVVRYGTSAKAKGLLLDADGNPVAGEEVTVVENFGAGALIRHRTTTAVTDERGKWRTKIPAGPSRDVRVSYDGSSRHGPAAKGVGSFVVRSRASFQTSRSSIGEGKTLEFTGRVGHFGARVPSGGKLVELQVRIRSGRWDTVGEAFRTNERGFYKRTYRFGHQYVQDTQFRFRVRVLREARWPYKRTNSVQRKVIVRAR